MKLIMPKSPIPGLDGIRGLAVLTVFLYHAQILPHVPGEFATTTFFFLSGFLITTLFLKEWRKTGNVDLKSFYTRRALRIFPPLYLVLTVALGLSLLAHVGGPLIPWKAAGNFLQYTNYAIAIPGDLGGFLPGMVLLWSLAVDEHYYLVFGPAFKAATKRFHPERIAYGLLAVCAAILAWRCYLVHVYGYADFHVSMTTDTRMDSILFGSFLALWRNPALEPERSAWLAKPWLVWPAVAILFIPFFSHNDEFKCTLGYTLEGLALMPLFAKAMLHGGRGVGRVLESPILRWSSRISYPLYLLSWLMITVCEKYVHGPRPLQMLVAFIAAYALGSAVHIWLEQPIMRIRKREIAPMRELMPVPGAA